MRGRDGAVGWGVEGVAVAVTTDRTHAKMALHVYTYSKSTAFYISIIINYQFMNRNKRYCINTKPNFADFEGDLVLETDPQSGFCRK